MATALDSHFELRSHTVCRGDQQRVVIAGGLQVEEGAKAAQRGLGPSAPRGPGQGLDTFDQRLSGINVDARLGVG